MFNVYKKMSEYLNMHTNFIALFGLKTQFRMRVNHADPANLHFRCEQVRISQKVCAKNLLSNVWNFDGVSMGCVNGVFHSTKHKSNTFLLMIFSNLSRYKISKIK